MFPKLSVYSYNIL